ncbi:MAG: hypothetical protein OXG91_03910, partial [bacterium]|nr:hypothetical protein [bacterium]
HGGPPAAGAARRAGHGTLPRRHRLSVTGGQAVGGIDEAMAQRLDRDTRLAVLGRLVEEYEAEHGFITGDEIAEQAQEDRDAAGSLRGAALRAG